MQQFHSFACFSSIFFFFIYPFFHPLTLSRSLFKHRSPLWKMQQMPIVPILFYYSMHEHGFFFLFVRKYNDQQTEQSWCVSGTNLNLFRLVDGIDFQFKPIFQVHAWILNAYRHLRNTMPSRLSLQNPFFAPIYAPAPFETTSNKIIRWNEILTQNFAFNIRREREVH